MLQFSDGWRYAYTTCLDQRLTGDVYRAPDKNMLARWRDEMKAMASLHVRKSRPSLATKMAEYVKRVAREAGYLSGKWMIFGTAGRSIENQWVKVKEAVNASQLGACAKFSDPSRDHPRRVICVYTYSFEDEEDIWRKLRTLHGMDVHPTSWKPDVLTHLGVTDPELKSGWFNPADCPCPRQPTKRAKREGAGQGAGEATKLAFVQLDQALDDDDEDCPELAESNSDDDGNGPVRARLNPITNT